MNGFDRIIGYSEIKEELCQIADILKNKERYDKLGVTFPAGLLLYGEPGVGKTLMAKSLAEEAGRKIFFCRKDELNKDFINTLKKTFSKAKENAPSVIILDDMDKFAKNSIYTTDSEEYSTIQALIDDVKDSSVFVIATANKRYCFPQSLLRAGRFDRIIEVEPPVGKDAENIVAYYIRDKAFEEDIDAQVISRIMSGKSCAALETVINEAGIFAGYKNSDVITMEHFFEACLKTVFNAPSESYSFYDDESDGNRLAKADASLKNLNDASLLQEVICHEAGHAVISEVMCPGSVTLVSAYSKGNDEGGFTSCYRDESVDLMTWLESRILCALGGMAAVEQKYGMAGFGAEADLKTAFDIVRNQVTAECTCGFSYHTSGDNDSETLRNRQEQIVAAEVDRYYLMAKEILARNEGLFREMTKELEKKKFLTAADIRKICKKRESKPLSKSAPGRRRIKQAG